MGLPLPVIPLFVHDNMGFSNLIIGLVIGIQFLATVLTRGYAGRLTDHHGGKRSALQGAAVCALGGLLYLVAAMPGLSPAISLAIIVVGRLAAGFGESQFVTGCVSWSIASVGPERAGMSMSWTGIAMFAALAVGAPIGMALYYYWITNFVAGLAACDDCSIGIVAGSQQSRRPACDGWWRSSSERGAAAGSGAPRGR